MDGFAPAVVPTAGVGDADWRGWAVFGRAISRASAAMAYGRVQGDGVATGAEKVGIGKPRCC